MSSERNCLCMNPTTYRQMVRRCQKFSWGFLELTRVSDLEACQRVCLCCLHQVNLHGALERQNASIQEIESCRSLNPKCGHGRARHKQTHRIISKMMTQNSSDGWSRLHAERPRAVHTYCREPYKAKLRRDSLGSSGNSLSCNSRAFS